MELISQLNKVIKRYVLLVEVLMTGIKMFERQKLHMITRSFCSKALDHLIASGSKDKNVVALSDLVTQRPPC